MEETSGAFEEKKRRKGGKRLMRAEQQTGAPRKKSGRGWKISLAAVGVLAAAYLGLGAWAVNAQRFYPNTSVNGVDCGGMTQQELAAQLNENAARAEDASVSFILPDGTEVGQASFAAVPEADHSRCAEEAFQCGGPGSDSILTAGASYLRTLFAPEEISADAADETEQALRSLGRALLRTVNCEPVEFSISVTEDGRVSATKPMDGRAVADDKEYMLADLLRRAYFSGGQNAQVTLYPAGQESGVYEVIPAQPVDLAAARESLIGEKVNAAYDKETDSITADHAGVQFALDDLQAAYDAAAPGETFTVKASVELPDVTAEQLREVLFRDELSSYTTRVGGAPGRHKNVQLTASRIDGYILNAGETMKYSPLVTPFTKANGYSPAPGYYQGKTVDMYGGGACQASSTLYAAALYANLEIVQRVNHGFASDYIGLGLDATVAEGGPEFEFRNNTMYPIKVRAEFYTRGKKDYIKVTLLGTKADDTYVKIRVDVLETIPFEEEIIETNELAAGERKVEQTAYTGYKVKTYRNVYSGDGKLISSTFEATSNYKARNRIVLVGKSKTTAPDPGATIDPGTTVDPAPAPDPGTEEPVPTTPVPEPPEEGTEMPEWLRPD